MTSVQIRRPQNPALRETHHQIDYQVNYGKLNIINPQQDLKIFIVQNNDWSRIIGPIPPTQIDLGQHQLTYTSFDNANSIPAWNEFRVFDTRRLANRGFHVDNQYVDEEGPQVLLELDHSKKGAAYAKPFQQDLNGYFAIANNDLLESQVNTEYVYVNFRLKTDQVPASVYVTGRFNDWTKTPANRMEYNTASGQYTASILMKQGYYNYRYETVSQTLDPYYFEGCHFQTQNAYEIYVYHREPGTVYDQLVGYQVF